MKKALTLLLISLVALSSVFAVSNIQVSSKPTDSSKAEVNVTLTVTPSQMQTYAFGFTSDTETVKLADATNLADVPTPFDGDLELRYDDVKGVATNVGTTDDFYMYYKIQAKEAIKLRLTPTNLKDGSENANASVPVTVASKKVTANGANGVQNPSINVTSDNDVLEQCSQHADITVTPKQTDAPELNYGLIQLTVTTGQIPPAKSVAQYAGTIALYITAA